MISAFAARPVIEFKQRDKAKIESVLAHGDRIFVGLNNGNLRIYAVEENAATNGGNPDEDQSLVSNTEQPQPSAELAELRREVEKFSKKPVQQLAIINDASVLVSLSDGYVSFHELETYNLSRRLVNSKGASLFATSRNIVNDPETGIPSIVSKLAVAVRRKLIVWTWQDMELSDDEQEFTVAAPVKSMIWADNSKMVVGMDPGFSMVNVQTGEISDINRTMDSGEVESPLGIRFGAVASSGMGYMGMSSYLPKPMATKLSEGEVLLAKDVNTLFIDSAGKPLGKRQVPWATSPEAIGYSYPFLLSLQAASKGQLDLRNPDTLTLLQSISLPNASLLHVPHPNISLAHAGKGFLVSSDRCIWRMDAIGYGPQLDELLQQQQFDEALSLVNLIEDTLLLDKYDRIHEIKLRKAFTLFESRYYRDALELFSEAEARPHVVIALYPESISGQLSPAKSTKESSASQSASQTASQAVTSPLSSPKKVSGSPAQRSKSTQNVGHKKKDSETMSIRSNGSASKEGSTPIKGKSLEGKDLINAVHELRAYLAQTRVQLQKYIDFDGKLKEPLRSTTNQGERPPFARFIEFDVNDDESSCEAKLLETARLVDTTLFRAYMLVSPKLAGSLFRLENFCSADVVEQKLYENGRYSELIDFLHGKRLHEEALKLLETLGKGLAEGEIPDGFRGPARTVKYLQQLPFERVDLILQYAEWPLREEPYLGMDVFLADTENAEGLPRKRVLEFLQSIHPSLTVLYLEHIIDQLNDETPAFHDQLAQLYLSQMKEGSGDQRSTLEKLERLLKDSQQYNKGVILRQLPVNDSRFYESRATVLRKLVRHKEALELYVYHMKNYKRAEEYCNQVYQTANASSSFTVDPDDTDSIYTILLSLYLKPPPPYAANLDAALDLLSVHGSRLPALATLAALPHDLPIQNLENYFRTRMRAANSISREEAIVASLRGVDRTAAESDLLLGRDWKSHRPKTDPASGRSRRAVLKEDMLCSICNKRFGRAAVRLWPDGRIVHYGCSDRRMR